MAVEPLAGADDVGVVVEGVEGMGAVAMCCAGDVDGTWAPGADASHGGCAVGCVNVPLGRGGEALGGGTGVKPADTAAMDVTVAGWEGGPPWADGMLGMKAFAERWVGGGRPKRGPNERCGGAAAAVDEGEADGPVSSEAVTEGAEDSERWRR